MYNAKTRWTAALLLAMLLLLTACSGPAGTQAESQAPGSAWELRRDKMTQEEADAVPSEDERVTISTACGDITGIQRDGYTEWRGIRYATADRFEDPVVVTGWSGTYDATAWGDRANQYYGFYNMADSVVNQFYMDESTFQWDASYSEDCLNLNIWAPDNASGCPVLVYIHGGSLVTGSNTDISTDGEAYARNGIVTVAINYRLGPFQQVYGDGYTGYLALLDQIAALHWVRDNIADYGGDGSKITVMGESAGAISVQNLLVSPLVEDGLISGAIMMSGGGDLSSLNLSTSAGTVEAEWNQVKQALGADSISDLKTVDAKELYAAWVKSSPSTMPFVNGVGLTETVGSALSRNAVKDVPVMIGMMSEDMWPYTLYTAALDYAAKRAAAGGQPVYLYYFDRQIDETFGAFHAGDLYYMFGTLYRNVREMDDIDYRISENMIAYVSNFVKAGNPNGGNLAEWEAADAINQKFMHFGDDEAEMVSPDAALLAGNQSSRPTFPYAAAIKTGTQAASGEKTPINHDEVLGKWLITGWIVPGQDGSEVTVDYEAVFEFTETERFYWVDGELSNTRTYVWDGDYDMVCTSPEGDVLVCAMYWGENNCLMIEDPRYGIAYTCYRIKGDSIGAEDLVGKWSILGWTSDADGSWTVIDPGQSYTFDGTSMIYDTGSEVYTTAYEFKGRSSIWLADWELTWPLWVNDQGQLCMEDDRYAITYVCEKQ